MLFVGCAPSSEQRMHLFDTKPIVGVLALLHHNMKRLEYIEEIVDSSSWKAESVGSRIESDCCCEHLLFVDVVVDVDVDSW